jgi:hypothetical protein
MSRLLEANDYQLCHIPILSLGLFHLRVLPISLRARVIRIPEGVIYFFTSTSLSECRLGTHTMNVNWC